PPATAAVYIGAGLLLGLLIYVAAGVKLRADKPFMGGEELPPEARAAGTEFYKTVSDMGFFRSLYRAAGKKTFDLYDLLTAAVLGAGKVLSRIHTGSLHTYLLLFLLGFTTLLLLLVR
ncbi:MAG: hypothetical protein ACYC5N_05120, partial [Endomicrobiales bacterium]